MMENRSKLFNWGILFIIVAIAVGLPLTRLVIFALSATQPGSPNSAIIEVHKGHNPNDVAKILIGTGSIVDGKSFIWLGKLTRQFKRIKAGEYKVSPAMTPVEIFSVITSGISVAHPVTIREGENMYEIGADLESKGLASSAHFVSLCRDQNLIRSLVYFKNQPPITLEGYLFPDTYFFNKTLTDADMIKQMVKHFFSFWNKEHDERAGQLKLSRNQVTTLASIIEKETGAPEERALISSVFHNRLQKRMRLQSDPTTIYGMWERFKGKIHKSDLSVKNAYNTYSIVALPIGPIANPGKEAIQAALFPAQSPFLYFVSHNDGTHQFSRTFEEHNRAVRKFQVDPKAREGKSWRDHLKKPASIKGQG